MKTIITALCGLILCLYAGFSQSSPEWTKDLVVYELNPKAFTSPNGPGSGTFKSTIQKLSYLKDLGINAIWLTGNSWGDASHFYHIWTQYACIRPDSIEPTLGSPEDFKILIDEAHKAGIRVFLDVITHGVMNYSPLIHEHPEWFRGGSWGMTDYDWTGNRKELDDWWVKTFTNYVVRYGVDGFRLDVDIYRPDLWKRIRENAIIANHPIVIFPEGWLYSDGACDFLQRQTTLSQQVWGIDTSNLLHSDVGKYFQSYFKKNRHYYVEIEYSDRSKQKGASDIEDLTCFYNDWAWPVPLYHGDSLLKVKLLHDPYIIPSNIKSEFSTESDYIRLLIENIDTSKKVKTIKVTGNGFWNKSWLFTGEQMQIHGKENFLMDLKPFVPDLLYFSVQLSCHDDGWEGFPPDLNPYVSEGSRCVFGYSCLFAPAIPIFMSGEEFNADYIPLPDHSPDLFGKRQPGKGKWLYASWIQWDQVKEKIHNDMLSDVKRMLAIRKQESDIFHAAMNDKLPNIQSLNFSTKTKSPVPYLLWNEKKAIMIAGNNSSADIIIKVKLLEALHKILPAEKYKISDLWSNTIMIYAAKELTDLEIKIKKDKVSGGGFRVLKIEPGK